jgi:hypothetical protein
MNGLDDQYYNNIKSAAATPRDSTTILMIGDTDRGEQEDIPLETIVHLLILVQNISVHLGVASGPG